MAFMKSNNTGKFYLTAEFSEWSDLPQEEASRVRAALGFGTEEVSPETINQERDRARANRALLIEEISNAVIAKIGAPTVDTGASLLEVLQIVQAAVNAIPTAEQNGQAARDAIVK